LRSFDSVAFMKLVSAQHSENLLSLYNPVTQHSKPTSEAS